MELIYPLIPLGTFILLCAVFLFFVNRSPIDYGKKFDEEIERLRAERLRAERRELREKRRELRAKRKELAKQKAADLQREEEEWQKKIADPEAKIVLALNVLDESNVLDKIQRIRKLMPSLHWLDGFRSARSSDVRFRSSPLPQPPDHWEVNFSVRDVEFYLRGQPHRDFHWERIILTINNEVVLDIATTNETSVVLDEVKVIKLGEWIDLLAKADIHCKHLEKLNETEEELSQQARLMELENERQARLEEIAKSVDVNFTKPQRLDS